MRNTFDHLLNGPVGRQIRPRQLILGFPGLKGRVRISSCCASAMNDAILQPHRPGDIITCPACGKQSPAMAYIWI